MLYMVYRWVVCLYFGGYLLAWMFSSGPHFFIYLTNWSYILLNVHLLYAALLVTVEYFKAYVCCRRHHNDLNFERNADEFNIIKPLGCFNSEYNQLSWYHMIQWVLFNIANQAAVCVVILYWSLLFRGGDVSLYDGHYHLGNGLIGAVDTMVSGLPVRLLHFYMIQVYGIIYTLFTGIYYAAGGTGYNGTTYIYPVLDYAKNPGSAAGLCIGVIILMPLLHLAFYALYVGRYWLVYLLYGRQRPHASRAPQVDNQYSTKLAMSEINEDVDDVH